MSKPACHIFEPCTRKKRFWINVKYICDAHWREIQKCGDHGAYGGGNCGGGISVILVN